MTQPRTPTIETAFGAAIHGDSLDVMGDMADGSVNLVVTSPPFALLRKKAYGNEPESEYLRWFKPFAEEIHRLLDAHGSFAVDLGGAWLPGSPTRSLYHFKLLIMLVEECGFHLAQEFYWWNPAKLPAPAEWVNIRRVRVKDAVNTVWWLSKTPWPKAGNRRVLQPYSQRQQRLIELGDVFGKRPSGHDISEKFRVDNGAAIPPNLIAVPNTESNGSYLRYCKEKGIKPHPARFPAEIPEYFIRLATDDGDLVLDPFAGSCTTGEVCERLGRRWVCVDLDASYLHGARGRFRSQPSSPPSKPAKQSYLLPRPDLLWDGPPDGRLAADGGQKRSTPASACDDVREAVAGVEPA